jgi:hypothetical protein
MLLFISQTLPASLKTTLILIARIKYVKFTRMGTKLTLVLDKDIIERAKSYASSKKTSLSKLIESYLDRVTAEEKSKEEISPLVKSLSGVISIPENIDYKDEYANHLASKYLND